MYMYICIYVLIDIYIVYIDILQTYTERERERGYIMACGLLSASCFLCRLMIPECLWFRLVHTKTYDVCTTSHGI